MPRRNVHQNHDNPKHGGLLKTRETGLKIQRLYIRWNSIKRKANYNTYLRPIFQQNT